MNKIEHFYKTIGEDWFNYCDLYKEMVEKAPNNSHFVEVGCWKGRSAAFLGVEIHNSEKNIKLDCVDTWMGSDEHFVVGGPCYEPMLVKNTEWLYNEFINNTKILNHIITPIRDFSVNAANLYEDNSLDFVYIDASHDYENVINDLKAWLPKIKVGGYIGGHDFSDAWIGVKNAVIDFFKNEKYILYSPSCGCYDEMSWLYQKLY